MFSDSYIARLNFIHADHTALAYGSVEPPFTKPSSYAPASSLLRMGWPTRLVCLTTSPPSFFSVLLPLFFFYCLLSLSFSLSLDLSLPLLRSFLSVSLPLFPCLCSLSFNSCLPFLFLFSLFLCKRLIFLSIFIPTAQVTRIQTVENNVSEAIKYDKHYFPLSRKCYLSILA